MVKRRYITFKVEDDLPDVALLRSAGAAREPLGVRCGRCMRFCGFCCVCTCTFFQALAPWMLAAIEVASELLLLTLLALPHFPAGPYSFHFSSSLEDLVLLGGLRAAALAGTYAWGTSHMQLRPYLYTSYVTGAGGLLYVSLKSWLFNYPLAWLPPAALMATFATFSWLHILAARYTVTWYRRRGQLGLLQGRWQGQAGSRRGASDSAPSPVWMDGAAAAAGDVPPELCADPDSRFIDVCGVVLHFKEAVPAAAAAAATAAAAVAAKPPGPDAATEVTAGAAAAGVNTGVADAAAGAAAAADAGAEIVSETLPPPPPPPPPPAAAAAAVPQDVGVVLIHGFGGGVFAWRHVMQPLADALGVRVVAFDRPGAGLSARPEVREDPSSTPEQHSPAPSSSGYGPNSSSGSGYGPSSSIGSGSGSGSNRASSGLRSNSGSGSGSGRGLKEPLLPTHTPPQQQRMQQQQHQQRWQQQQRQQQLQQQLMAAVGSNPYSIDAQAFLTLQFCKELGLNRVLLVAHADGCVLAARVAAVAAAAAQQMQQQQQRGHLNKGAVRGSRSGSGGGGNINSGSGRRGAGAGKAAQLDSQGSLDFSWMGSLSQAAAAAAAAAGAAGALPPSLPPLPPTAADAAGANPQGVGPRGFTSSMHRVVEELRGQEGGVSVSGDDASLASSLSFQSLLAAGANSSRNDLCDSPSESEGGGVTSGHTSGGGAVGHTSEAGAGAVQAASSDPQSRGRPSSSSSTGGGSASHTAAAAAAAAGGPQTEGDPGGSTSAAAGAAQQQQVQPQGSSSSSQLQAVGSLVLMPPCLQGPHTAAGAKSRSGSGGGSSGGGRGSSGGGGSVEVPVWVCGVALLHPTLSCSQVPSFTRLLAGSSLGRSMLRPLLRSEVGVVANRRAWHNPDLLTREVLALYKRPLRVEGWEFALLATSRVAASLSPKQVLRQFAALQHTPVLLLTGEFDRIATPAKVSGVAALLSRVQRSVIPACGHLSHEEAPQQLLELLVGFCRAHLHA